MLGTSRRFHIFAVMLIIFPASIDSEVHSVESYGICSVITDVDDFTDEITHGLFCVPDLNVNTTVLMSLDERMRRVSKDMVAILCNEETQHRIMMKGNLDVRAYYSGEFPIDVRYRFDKGNIYEELWTNVDWWGGAATDDTEIVARFVAELASVKDTLVFGVKETIVRLDLADTDSASALVDYNSRCNQSFAREGGQEVE